MRKNVRVLAAIVALAVVGTTASAASAAPPSIADKLVDRSISRQVVFAGQGVEQENGDVFYETGPVSADTLIVVPDDNGLMPGGLTRQEAVKTYAEGGVAGLRRAMDSTREAEGSASSAPLGSSLDASASVNAISQTFITGLCCTWQQFTHPTALWGWDDTATVNYRYAVQAGTRQSACAEGRHYYRGYNGSDFGVWSTWSSLGCKSAGIGWKTASFWWGSIIAYPQAKFRSNSYTFISNGEWGY